MGLLFYRRIIFKQINLFLSISTDGTDFKKNCAVTNFEILISLLKFILLYNKKTRLFGNRVIVFIEQKIILMLQSFLQNLILAAHQLIYRLLYHPLQKVSRVYW